MVMTGTGQGVSGYKTAQNHLEAAKPLLCDQLLMIATVIEFPFLHRTEQTFSLLERRFGIIQCVLKWLKCLTCRMKFVHGSTLHQVFHQLVACKVQTGFKNFWISCSMVRVLNLKLFFNNYSRSFASDYRKSYNKMCIFEFNFHLSTLAAIHIIMISSWNQS